MSNPEDVSARAIRLLGQLVAFDTTSQLSNLKLIDFVENFLSQLGIASRRVPNKEGDKSSLFATIGADVRGGVVLSGHTDVVPTVGQPWSSNPYEMVERDGRLYGRGTCDMKGFLALALAAAQDLSKADLKRPVHLAFSYDEEVGCLGAPDLIKALAGVVATPSAIIVGEPTSMEAVSGHKGVSRYRITATGHEAHSSLTHLGVSANQIAIKLMASLDTLAERLAADVDPASPFLPKESTVTVGIIEGGTADNILARQCQVVFELRTIAGDDAADLLAKLFEQARKLDRQVKARFPNAGVTISTLADVPALAPERDGIAESMVRRLAGDNGPARVVSYGTEAGQFQQAGFSTIVCGPGSIDQAHQADEFIAVSQMQRGGAFMSRLVEQMST